MRRAILLLVACVVVGFCVLHAAGARAHVGLLSGNVAGRDIELVVGCVYVLAWFAAVIAVPIALLALLLDAACVRIVACWSRR